jgi:hypothetical protein
MLAAITAKSDEDCKEILARYPPGGSRMSLASNEVFGMELAGGEVRGCNANGISWSCALRPSCAGLLPVLGFV